MNQRESVSARWTRIINEQRASGLSIAEFCRRREVSPPSFYDWRRRLSAAGHAGQPKREVPAFVEVMVGPCGASPAQAGDATADASLELILRDGLRVRVRHGFDRELLRELVAALELPQPTQPTRSPEVSA